MMLSQEDAISIVEKAVNLKCKNIKEFDDYYLLLCSPEKSVASNEKEYLDGAFVIYKDNKKIERYNPLLIGRAK